MYTLSTNMIYCTFDLRVYALAIAFSSDFNHQDDLVGWLVVMVKTRKHIRHSLYCINQLNGINV